MPRGRVRWSSGPSVSRTFPGARELAGAPGSLPRKAPPCGRSRAQSSSRRRVRARCSVLSHCGALLWRRGGPAGTETVSSWAAGLGSPHPLRLRPLSRQPSWSYWASKEAGPQMTLQLTGVGAGEASPDFSGTHAQDFGVRRGHCAAPCPAKPWLSF